MAPIVYIQHGFAIFFLIFWCIVWITHLIAIFYGKWKLYKRNNMLTSTELSFAGVSILKPLVGVDPNLFVNLESFFTMNYPKYELLFCIENEWDPAIMVVKRLLEKYPEVDASLFIGGCIVGVNPKINNMQHGYVYAKYEYVLISDSNIRMKEDTLLDMMHHMMQSDDIALVHQLPFTCDRKGLAATIEKVFFGTIQARIYLAADLLRFNCHIGMSGLMRKKMLDDVGGLRAFGCYLSEDFFMAQAFIDRGWRVCICSQPAWQNAGVCEVISFQNRLKRWAKLRIAMLPRQTIILEPLSECMLNGICASWAISFLFGCDSVVFFMIHILIWFLLDWILLSIVQNGMFTFNKFEFVVAWMFRECSSLYVYLHALWNPNIKWRSRMFRLSWGGVARELKSRFKY